MSSQSDEATANTDQETGRSLYQKNLIVGNREDLLEEASGYKARPKLP